MKKKSENETFFNNYAATNKMFFHIQRLGHNTHTIIFFYYNHVLVTYIIWKYIQKLQKKKKSTLMFGSKDCEAECIHEHEIVKHSFRRITSNHFGDSIHRFLYPEVCSCHIKRI